MKTLLGLFCVLWILSSTAAPLAVEELRCEHLANPIGIGSTQPRLSWKLRSKREGELQTAYQIHAASSVKLLNDGKADLWDSRKMISDESVLMAWKGKALGSRSQVFWQVRVWGKDGEPSTWSEVASFELGLLSTGEEWKGKWITSDLPRYDMEGAALANAFWINAGTVATQAVGVSFTVDVPTNSTIRRATIDAAADGYITIYVNGQATHQGPTSRTVPLLADVRTQLVSGTNMIAISSAAVRNAARIDRGSRGRNAIAAHGTIELMDGRRIEFNTDDAWKARSNPGGDWYKSGQEDSTWAAATAHRSYAEQPSNYSDNTIGPGRYFRKEFAVSKPVAKARLYATALGVYEATVNGERVSDSVLEPGWTDYTKRVMVQTYDVTKLVARGQNVMGMVLSDGWYAGRLGWMGLAQYGVRPACNVQLEITYSDGSREIIATDASWKTGAGEIIGSDQQWGEVIDARANARESDVTWTNAIVEEHKVALDPQLGPPVRRLIELAPQHITRNGESWIVDFGQNLVGHVRLTARGKSGDVITVNHAEMLDPDGTLYTANLRVARSLDTFILRGGGSETFEPHFTFHGFRYVEITGLSGELKMGDLRAVVIGSDMPRIGNFECSNPALNRLYENIIWGQRGNFLSVPTDCPQRDERMGWMGDAQVFAPTAAYSFDVAPFFTKWMVDVNDGQTTNGDYADFSPRVARPQAGWPVWGDAGVIIPWHMFVTSGDTNFLAQNYPAMTRWVDFNERRAKNLILSGGVGDHLAPQRTPIELVDTAYFANSAGIVAKAAALLGKPEDALKYRLLRDLIESAFNEAFVSTNGVIRGDTQTAYILALRFDLLPENLRSIAAQRLAENVETNGHLTTGFVGVGLICPALSQIGRSDLAWQLALTDTYPSWLFSVKNGATTIWERWDGWTPERGFQDPAMNSFNHYSLGAIGAWFYSGAAGIQSDPAHPGYKHFFLKPEFTTRLSYVKASLDSPYGMISSHWRTSLGEVTYEVIVPPNTTADVILPVPLEKVWFSGKQSAERDGQSTRIALGAGTYQFSFPIKAINAKK